MASTIVRHLQRAAGLSRNTKLFLVMIAINGFANGMIWLFLNLFILARGNDKLFLGLLMSLISLAALFLGVPMGIMTDRIGRKRAMLLGALLSGGAVGVLVLSPLDWPLLAGAVMLGAGNALYMAAGPAFIAENASEEDRPTAYSLQASLQMLVAFAGSAIAGGMPGWFAALLHAGPESATAYRATLAVAWGVMALSLIPLLLIREQPRPMRDAASQGRFSLRSLPLRRDVFRLIVPQLVLALGAGLLIPYLNVFLKESFAISDSLLGWAFAIYQLLVGVGTLAAPILAERWGEVRVIVATQLLSLPFLLVLGFVPVLGVAIAALWLRAVLMNMGNPLYTSFAMRQARDEERGTVGAMLGVSWSVGQMFGPGISGVVQQVAGFPPLFLTTAATYLVSSLLLQAFFRGADRQVAAKSEPLHTM